MNNLAEKKEDQSSYYRRDSDSIFVEATKRFSKASIIAGLIILLLFITLAFFI